MLCAYVFSRSGGGRRGFVPAVLHSVAPCPQTHPARRQIVNVRPLYDRVLVKRLEEDKLTKGGLIIPDTAKEKPVQGEVVAVGSGRRL